MIVAGSVCKDFSSMGKGEGFLGNYVTLCAVFLTLCKICKPALVIHECTPRFPFKIFEETLSKYTDHHSILNAQNFGVPVSRNRSWDALVNPKWKLDRSLEEIHGLASKCVLDAGVWLQAPEEEARRALVHLVSPKYSWTHG